MGTFAMYGTFHAQPGRRDELLGVMLEGQVAMDGCELYLVGPHPEDADAICIVEHWRDQAAHDASLTVPEVQATIAKARPLIAGMSGTGFTPAGGIGA